MINYNRANNLTSTIYPEKKAFFSHKRIKNKQPHCNNNSFTEKKHIQPFQFHRYRSDFKGDTLLFAKKHFDQITEINESITNNRAIELALLLFYLNKLGSKESNNKISVSIEELNKGYTKKNKLPFILTSRTMRSMINELESYQLIKKVNLVTN